MRRVSLSIVVFVLLTKLVAQTTINGPMPGYSECLEGIVWMQCHEPCIAQMEYWKEGQQDSVLSSAEVRGLREKAFAIDLIADQVLPGTTYEYRVLVNGERIANPEPLRFKTQPLWKFRGDPPEFTFATGSCAYINELAYDRPGKPYGGGMGIFNSIADQKPDFMLWLGDNIYLREPDWGSWSGYLHRYTHLRSTPEIQKLLRSTHHYAIWDDHDFGPNDADGSFVNAEMAREAFDLFWPNPPRTAPGVGGTTTSFTYADVDFFLLDDRTFRVPPEVLTDSATMLGDAQIDWLIRALKYSDASFKMIALGGQFLNSAAVYETYSMYPLERQRILDRLNAEGIKGVVFITGDRHHTVLSKLNLPNGQPVYDLTVSPLTSSVHEPKESNTLAVEGTLVSARNFATVRFKGPLKQRIMSITIRDENGKELWTKDIQAP
ncbi:MAG: alkaline phosphatase family protein [Flavobacteriales bacterium]|nr:alkaline phosphatase family protein [Flavobacteriales bacterium]